jgi:chromosome segregation ATPase
VVDDLKATMESRVREIVSEASELSGELSGSKEVISSLEKRMEAEKARMTSRIQSLESRNKLLSVEASDLKQRCSDRDQIMSYTLQRLVKMSEVNRKQCVLNHANQTTNRFLDKYGPSTMNHLFQSLISSLRLAPRPLNPDFSHVCVNVSRVLQDPSLYPES